MFPAKNSRHSPKTTQNKENEKQMFLPALNEKVNWTKHSKIQNLSFFFFISGVFSFTIFQIILITFTLKPFIYFIYMWEQKQPLRGVPYNYTVSFL